MNDQHSSNPIGSHIKFIVLSLIGIALFMIPFATGDGGMTVLVAQLSDQFRSLLEPYIPTILFSLTLISAIGAVLFAVVKTSSVKVVPQWIRAFFETTPVWIVIRVLAAVFMSMIYFDWGLEAVTSGDTGGMVFESLLPILLSIFLFAGLFLPLLLNFGLLEFVGTLLIRVMRPVFNLPGRSAIDCIASWLGDGTIGVLLTSKQYEDGFYTKREAAVIGTTFSLVSITFSLVVIDTVGLAHMFLP
ncbi:MAG: nucleoside recognition domain-containing protein, partial [Bacilli bacterium]